MANAARAGEMLPRRIGLVSFAWTDNHNGGLRSHVHDLALHLSTLGITVHAHCVNTDPQQPPFATCSWQENGIQVQQVNYSYHDTRTLFDFQKVPHIEFILSDWAHREQLDLIHIHHNLFVGMGIIPALASSLPVITSLHDYWPLDPRGQLFAPPYDTSTPKGWAGAWLENAKQTWPQLVAHSQSSAAYFAAEDCSDSYASQLQQCWLAYSRHCLTRSQRLVAPSQATANIFRAYGIQQPIRVIENGVPTDHLAGGVLADSATRGQSSSPIRLVVLGNIAPSKGQLAFCRACLNLTLHDQLEVVLFGACPQTYQGDPEPQSALQQLCSDHPELFKLAGAYERHQLPTVFSQADLVVVPSLWEEVYGLVAREALSYGLPLIVSSAGGLFDLAGRSRVFVLNHREPQHWQVTLEHAFSEGPLLRWIYQRRRGQMPPDSQVRSSRECGDELLALYREILAQSG